MQEKKESLWKNCWKNRTLIWRLTKNDFKKRYAGSYLGMVWAMIQPIITVVVYWFVFEKGLSAGAVKAREDVYKRQREDLVTILFRYTKYRGKKITGSSDLTQFSDAGTISGYAIPAMQWAVANGIVSGRGNTGLLDPKGNATRVECAAMIQRYRNNIK